MVTPFPWDDYRKYRISTDNPGHSTSAEVVRCLDQLHSVRPEGMVVEELGRSVEGRPISLVTIGQGSHTVLLWSQMHGDESTHTHVLLDLLSLLQRSPEHPHARAILAGCTLRIVPLLNPDGAGRQSRHNAQDIDINRDARQLQTPEGRILKGVVERLRPDFAFNLHNQNARTTVGPEHQLAAVSLLVPAVDWMGTETDNMRQAKRLASALCQAIATHCQGMISRYDADFMPRSFGEAIQTSGAATLLIEAGDWPVEGAITLEQLHFVGLVSALGTIATDALDRADPAVYERLPRSNEHRRFDLLIRGATLDNGLGHEPFVADVGINHVSTTPHRIQIVDLGDLGVTTGRQVVEGEGLICQPGRARIDQRINPLSLPSHQRCRQLLMRGVTSLVGVVDLADMAQIDRLVELETDLELPIDLGFVGACGRRTEAEEGMVREHLLQAIAEGLLGVLAESPRDDVRRYAQWFQVPLLGVARETGDEDLPAGILPGQGTIQRGSPANLLLVDPAAGLRLAIVGGMVVLDQGELTGHEAGRLLRRGG
jgi:hypothetical protein